MSISEGFKNPLIPDLVKMDPTSRYPTLEPHWLYPKHPLCLPVSGSFLMLIYHVLEMERSWEGLERSRLNIWDFINWKWGFIDGF